MDEAPKQVHGREIELEGGRSVFIGKRDEGDFLVKFVNSEGKATNLKLSREATAAFVVLALEHVSSDVISELIAPAA